MSTFALVALLAFAAGASAADRPRPGDPVAAAPNTASPAELAQRRGWLVFAQIDDARDALRVGQPDQAARRIEQARATAASGRDGDARLAARLADAARALAAHDPAGADGVLADVSSRLRGDLVAADLRAPPAIARAPSGETDSYGGYGFGARGLTGGGRAEPLTIPVVPPSGSPWFRPIEPYRE